MRMTHWPALAVILALVSACGTSTPVRYFNLKPLAYSEREESAETRIVGLGPLDLPGYLARPQIVTRGEMAEIIIDDFRRWAEPVDESIHRVVAANVESFIDGVTVVSYPYHTMAQPEYRVYGDVVRFDADETGRAVLIVQWGIAGSDRTAIMPPQRSRYVSQAAAAADTGAVVMALNDVVAQFSKDIAARLREALAE